VVLPSLKEHSGLPSSALALRKDGLGLLACQESSPQHPSCGSQKTNVLKYCAPTYVILQLDHKRWQFKSV